MAGRVTLLEIYWKFAGSPMEILRLCSCVGYYHDLEYSCTSQCTSRKQKLFWSFFYTKTNDTQSHIGEGATVFLELGRRHNIDVKNL